MKKQSIIHIVPSIANEASGPSYSVVRLCESLIECQQSVTLAALDRELTNVPPHFLKTFPPGSGPRRLGRSPLMKKWLDEMASSNAVDIIHNHSLWMMPNIYSGKTSKKYDIPLVISPRGTLSEWAMKSGAVVKRVFWPLLQKPAIDSTTCFHATAYSEYEDIRRLGFRQPVAIIPNGIDLPSLKVKKPDSMKTLLFLGRVHPIKGVDLLLNAWKLVSSQFPQWKLQIVGPDNRGYLPEMQSLASELGLKRIEFLGPVYGEDKIKLYQDADLFVLPTHSENFGMTVAEALAAGTPAIVSKGAPWDGLETHAAGWWIDVGVEPLIACLEDAMGESPENLLAMGQRGREWMAEEYSWKEVARKMNLTYKWILGENAKPDWVIVD